jgi:DNA-binding response OmpR family regulator
MTQQTILLADDDSSTIDMLEEMLTRDGYAVEIADAAHTCVEALEARRFSAVLLDLSLPGMTQEELFAALLALPSPSPLIVFSARRAEEVGSIAAQLDAAAVLVKPSSRQHMLATIARVTRRAEA